MRKLLLSCFGLSMPGSQPYDEAKIMMIGEETSGKTEIFLEVAQQALPVNPATIVSSKERSSASSNSLVPCSEDLEQPLQTTTSDDVSAAEGKAKGVQLYGTWIADDNRLPVMAARPWFETSSVLLVDVPSPARFDHQFLHDQVPSAICYVISMDTIDQVDPVSGKNLMDIELENLYSLLDGIDRQFVGVYLTKLDALEQKFRTANDKLSLIPPHLLSERRSIGALTAMSARELSFAVADLVGQKIHRRGHGHPHLYVFSADSGDDSNMTFAKMVRSVILSAELASAGFIG